MTTRREILDHPSERSSHSRPTPRGGGLAIVVTVLVVVIGAAAVGWVEPRLAAALVGGGGLVAWVGWQDDRRSTPAALRALVQCVAACWAVAWLGGYPAITLTTAPLRLGLAGSVLAVVGIVWAVNLFNFMDGIDGIAGVEACTIATTGSIMLGLNGADGGALVSATIGAATLGFLRWNWMPARIFLGDVGSNFLGFSFGVLAVWSENSAGIPAVWWGLAALVFIFDATTTLVRRVVRREPIFKAHRSHAYQRLAQAGWSHAAVSRAILLLNLGLGGLAVTGFAEGWPPWLPLAGGAVTCGWVYRVVERRRPM
ncbi:MAG: glycosyltransferase family 4 protein [Gemmatimonadota bacterium]